MVAVAGSSATEIQGGHARGDDDDAGEMGITGRNSKASVTRVFRCAKKPVCTKLYRLLFNSINLYLYTSIYIKTSLYTTTVSQYLTSPYND